MKLDSLNPIRLDLDGSAFPGNDRQNVVSVGGLDQSGNGLVGLGGTTAMRQCGYTSQIQGENAENQRVSDQKRSSW